MRGICARRHQHRAVACIAASAAAVAVAMAASAARVDGAQPPHSHPSPSCLDTAKVRKSTAIKPFNLRYRIRCDYNVRSITLDTTNQLTRVQAAPTVEPSSAGSFRCERKKPRKVSCSGTTASPNAPITILLRVKPGPCKKPRLKLSGVTRGLLFCTPGTPCVEPIVGSELSATASGC